MNTGLVLVSIALGAALLAGCDRGKEVRGKESDAAQKAAVVNIQPPPQAAAKTTELGKTPPIQGQVDTREPAQRKAFETTK